MKTTPGSPHATGHDAGHAREGTPTAEAVEAARAVLHNTDGIECDHVDGKTPCCSRDALAAVTAAYPFIAAAERTRIAHAIRTEAAHPLFQNSISTYAEGARDGLAAAAKIAQEDR